MTFKQLGDDEGLIAELRHENIQYDVLHYYFIILHSHIDEGHSLSVIVLDILEVFVGEDQVYSE
jgi:hypothetical protein